MHIIINVWNGNFVITKNIQNDMYSDLDRVPYKNDFFDNE